MTNKNEDPFEKMGNDYLFQESEEDLSAEPKHRKKPGKKNSNKNFWIAAAIMLVVFILTVGVLIALTMMTLPKIQAARMEQAAMINAHNTATVQAATDTAFVVAEITEETPSPAAEIMPTQTEVMILFSDTPVPEATEAGGAAAQAATETGAVPPVETTAVEETEAAAEETTAVAETPTEETPVPTQEATLETQAAAQVTETAATEIAQATTAVPAAGTTAVSTPEAAALATGSPEPTSTALPETGLANGTGMPGLLGAALALILVIILSRRARLSN